MSISNIDSHASTPDVCVIGLGYVGLTLAVALALAEQNVIGYERNRATAQVIRRGEAPFFEEGLSEGIAQLIGGRLLVIEDLPNTLPPVVVICVGTPVYPATREPDVSQLTAAVQAVAERMTGDTLVVIRSTVAVGTCRNLVLPLLRRRVPEPLLAFCPERTIQGKALEELRTLPQVVGGVNQLATERARAFFETTAQHVIPVSSLEAAEMIKLICNAHTDLIYGFGNEVAMIAEGLGLDACELISTANLNYPRPDLSKPGFVGGSCLTKDPYLLMLSSQQRGYQPPMVAAARHVNEALPGHVAQRVIASLRELGRDPAHSKIFISGFAYKGQPETDDLRGSPIAPILEILQAHTRHLVGHDFIVPPEKIAALGVEPASLRAGFDAADAVLILNNHKGYAVEDARSLVERMNRPAVLFDAWGVWYTQLNGDFPDVHYTRWSWKS